MTMASSIATYIVLSTDLATGKDNITEVPFQNNQIHIPKQTCVNIIGGIFCNICGTIYGTKQEFETHYSAHNKLETVYTCLVCKKEHATYPSFRNHCYLQHTSKDKFECSQCDKSFVKQSILKAHISTVHDFKCGECDAKFSSKKEYNIHKIMHHKQAKEDPPYNCTKCSFVIKSIEMCDDHLNEHSEILYPCPICALVLKSKTEATQHLTEHFDEELPPALKPGNLGDNSSIDILGGILCCHCDELFKNRSEIDSHFATQHDDKEVVYSCNICEKPYTKYSLFGNHCYFHMAKDKFKCEECNRLFPRLPLLVMHNLAFHCEGAVDKPYRCDTCIYGFKSHYRLIEHKRLAHDEVTIRCKVPDCNAIFNTPKELVTHQQGHQSALDNWCRQCGLQFTTLRACEKHLDVHRRTQFVCPVCERSYRERHLIVKHLPKHFETVLHICKICGRSYKARNRLIAHAKSHTEQKKHKCAYCNKTFSRLPEMEQHERVHTGHKPYQCTVCEKTFASYPNWTKHLSRAHSYNKDKIKEVREAHKQASDAPNSRDGGGSVKAESGIESAGSEFSDLYAFIESDDSSDDRDGPIKKLRTEINLIMESIDIDNKIGNDPKPNENSVISTDDAVINGIELNEDLRLITPVALHENLNGTGDFNEFEPEYRVDDSSDIKAIVEHIDALSGDMEMPAIQPEIMQFTEMMPVENMVYNTVPAYTIPALGEPPYRYQPTSVPLEYGPDFTTLGTETYTDIDIGNLDNHALPHIGNLDNHVLPHIGNLDDHVLPHIDPLLTIKAQQNAKNYIQNVPNVYPNTVPLDQNWEPILSKVFTYEESNDRMFVLNGNIF